MFVLMGYAGLIFRVFFLWGLKWCVSMCRLPVFVLVCLSTVVNRNSIWSIVFTFSNNPR